VDWRARSVEGIPAFDAHNYGNGLNRLLFARSPSAATAVYLTSGFSVLEFSIVPEPSPGDFNGDGLLDAVDIDRLSMEIRTAGGDLAFDLNDDVLVNAEDRRLWVKELRNTYFGDTDLDGAFNSSDMIQVFVKGKYETGEVAGWVEGDWDGNGFFDSSDMITAFRRWRLREGATEGGVRGAGANIGAAAHSRFHGSHSPLATPKTVSCDCSVYPYVRLRKHNHSCIVVKGRLSTGCSLTQEKAIG